MSKITEKQLEYAIEVLSEQLKEDAGKYVAQEMLKRASDEGDVMATLFGGLMNDSSVDDNCHALSSTIKVLQRLQSELVEADDTQEKANDPTK